jgi:hypothetical protein
MCGRTNAPPFLMAALRAVPEHAALITVLILERPMCADCIATKVDLDAITVRTYLARIAHSVTVKELPDERCRTCGITGAVYSIDRD